MTDPHTFEKQTKIRSAELIMPPNLLRKKMGTGGMDASVIAKAQDVIDSNTIDFKPIAIELLEQLNAALEAVKSDGTRGKEAVIESVIYPAMQLKAQGAMFHYPLVTDISDVLVNFLETVTDIDKDVLEIILAHKKVITAVINTGMSGNTGVKGKELRDSLMAACMRYYKAKEALQPNT